MARKDQKVSWGRRRSLKGTGRDFVRCSPPMLRRRTCALGHQRLLQKVLTNCKGPDEPVGDMAGGLDFATTPQSSAGPLFNGRLWSRVGPSSAL